MTTALFVIGTCIRLAGTDPWQSLTWRVWNVGKYSYQLVDVDRKSSVDLTLPFEWAKWYEEVSCLSVNKKGGL